MADDFKKASMKDWAIDGAAGKPNTPSAHRARRANRRKGRRISNKAAFADYGYNYP